MKLALLAGTQSGCGKTTAMLALLQYIKAHEHSITAFKSGPDFLDPLWHQAVTGTTSYNLDTHMIGATHSQQLLTKQAEFSEFALIEGVMGLFDGRTGVGGSGSSAELAHSLKAPVFLVVNAKGISGSIVPLVSGFVEYAHKMDVHIAGIIANHVGSAHHASLLSSALKDYQQPPLIAWLEKNAPILPERHLGLMQPSEIALPNLLPFLHVEQADFLSLFRHVSFPVAPVKTELHLIGKKIAIAKDAACCFIYQANLDFLQAEGAELCFFSPLASEAVPTNADALWLPGGYPELFAEDLSHSTSWLSIQDFINANKPVLAECGGAMLLGESLFDYDAKQWPLANILPFQSKMQTKLASLGYREEASGIKGHEFHHSKRVMTSENHQTCFSVNRGDQGIRYKNVRASYVHWYFDSAPSVVCAWFNGE